MSPPPHASRPERIGAILRERIDALGWERRLREEEVVAGWDAAVGPQIASHARASHIANRRLTVVTENPVWTQQLSLLRTELLRRLAGLFGPEAVTELYFVTGRLEPASQPQAPAPSNRLAPETLPETLERELDVIADAGVRESVRRLILAALADERPAGGAAGP